jgi:hypothetical protein
VNQFDMGPRQNSAGPKERSVLHLNTLSGLPLAPVAVERLSSTQLPFCFGLRFWGCATRTGLKLGS